ncbi:MAG: D-arabinono-1,4-lactone oxidase [Mycobacterium sp.]|nr:D-arabinono-1,4-lactone oxidase [Mycobacterium sp.]
MKPWANWAGEQRCTPASFECPPDEAAVSACVTQAARRGATVRAVGSGHSFTDVACTDGVMVDMSGMQRILDIDQTAGRVTVEGGIKLHALGPLLAERGLALANQGDIDRQSITGAISTATHGTGARLPNLSAQIVGMRLVTATGEVRELSEATDREALLAARVSMGALGVITAVTIQTVPLYTLHRHDQTMPLPEVLDRLDEITVTSDHFEFFVFPYAARAITRTTRRSTAEPHPAPAWQREARGRLDDGALGTLCRIGRRFPSQVPRLNRLMTAAASNGDEEDHAYRIYPSRREVRFTEMEYAIDRIHARSAIEQVIALVRSRQLPILFPLEVRFVAADDAFLSPSHRRDTCYIAVHQYTGMEYECYLRGVEAIMDSFGGRPHWGKRHYQTAATLRPRYPEWDRFQHVRAQFDPDGVFGNDYTRRVLGLTVNAGTPA